VYQRNLDGTGWESTPLATLTLTDHCMALLQEDETPRLALNGSSCNSSWLSLGNTGEGGNATAAGDQLIDNFYKRGRKVKVELFNNVAATGTPVVIIKRVEGVPPKFAALAKFKWLEMDATTKAALINFDGTAAEFPVSWTRNTSVSGKDVSFCLGASCEGDKRGGHDEITNGKSEQKITLNRKPAGSSAYKSIGIYGRNSDQLGVSSNYVSCGGLENCQ
jgi:hypothetical protein